MDHISPKEPVLRVIRWPRETIAAGRRHTVGLKSDGTVMAVGWNGYGQCNVSDWHHIVAIAEGCTHTVGVKSDGTVIAVGDNEYGQCDVSGWSDIQIPRVINL